MPSLLLLNESKGSMTLEAAVVLPLFLFFGMNLLSVMEMLRFHGNIAWALNEIGGKMAVYGYGYRQIVEEESLLTGAVGDAVFSYTYIREEIERCLGEEYLADAPVTDGKMGILFSEANLMGNDRIEFVLSYRMKMPFDVFGLCSIRTSNRYCARAWTGYDVSPLSGDCVFVTENASVYHLYRECTHLKLSIREVYVQEVELLRNSSGRRYTACEKCQTGEGTTVFVTEEGDKYHGERECSGLKRTIYQITEEEAMEKGYPLCGRCKETGGLEEYEYR